VLKGITPEDNTWEPLDVSINDISAIKNKVKTSHPRLFFTDGMLNSMKERIAADPESRIAAFYNYFKYKVQNYPLLGNNYLCNLSQCVNGNGTSCQYDNEDYKDYGTAAVQSALIYKLSPANTQIEAQLKMGYLKKAAAFLQASACFYTCQYNKDAFVNGEAKATINWYSIGRLNTIIAYDLIYNELMASSTGTTLDIQRAFLPV